MKYLATTLLSAFVSAADLMSPLVSATDFLKVEGDHFTLRGSQVFLSGGNQAWIDYGNDFGNGQSYSKRCDLQKYIKDTADAGGNSIRIWLFTEGQSIP
jgi:mannan endo-1,4-beta-mannosidase